MDSNGFELLTKIMVPGTTYHIYNHANGSENLFREDDNYRYFLMKYKRYVHPVANTFAYNLLPNHFHFLLKIKEEKELKDLGGFENLQGLEYPKRISKCFSNFFNSYVKGFNEKYNRKGSLFYQNFRRKPIESTAQWQDTFLYIHLNAVKHGFVTNPETWPWSSWNAYLQMENETLVDRAVALEYFDNIENMVYGIKSKRENILSISVE